MELMRPRVKSAGHSPNFPRRSSQSMYDGMYDGRALAKSIPILDVKTACCYLKQHAVFIMH